SRYERGEISGVSHFIEHMLFKGSQRYPTARTVSETIEGVGGVLDAETGKELTVYSTKSASTHFDLALDLLTDMVRHPLLEPAELEKERRGITQEVNGYQETPHEGGGGLGQEAFLPGPTLGREGAGTRAAVDVST